MNQLTKSEQLYALYAIPEDDCSSIHGISLNKEKLQEILETQVSEEYKHIVTFEITAIPTFILTKLINPTATITKVLNLFGTNNDLSLMKTEMFNLQTYKNKIFGFNKKLLNGNYIESLIIIAHDSEYGSDAYTQHLNYINEQYMFKNKISTNPIDLDIYYDEDILNN